VEIASILKQTVSVFIAWGFWLVYHYLRGQGHGWNHKKVYRIWKEEGLHLRKVPKRSKIKRKHLNLLPPALINEGWSVDFLSDWVVGPGKHKVRIVNVMDECSRKALWTEAHESITAQKLTVILDEIVAWRGKPSYIRCDNGPEFISYLLEQWAEQNNVEIKYIQPGKPSQNGLIERLNGTLRTECLNLEWFTGMETLNERIQEWWHIYNSVRPHSSIAYRTPDQFEQENSNLYFRVVAA
jgi:putative transposase